MEKRGQNQFFFLFLSYLTYRETVHMTQPFGKLKQTLSKKQNSKKMYLQNLNVESVIKKADP